MSTRHYAEEGVGEVFESTKQIMNMNMNTICLP